MTTDTHAGAAPGIARSLFVLSIFYGGMVCIAGVLANKQVTLGPISELGTVLGVGSLAVEAGIFAFLFLVAVSSAVAELFGRRTANQLVLLGFIPLIVSTLLALLVLSLPAAPFMTPESQAAFERMMAQTPRIWIGGITAYGISQILNVYVFSVLKRDGGGLLWLRAAVAAMLSQAVDTLIFITVAFYDPQAGFAALEPLLVGQMLAKVVLSAVAVPPLIVLAVKLGRSLDRTPTT